MLGVAAIVCATSMPGWAATAAGQPAQGANAADNLLSPAALQKLVGPIALYPDELLSIVLPASTQPLQIVEAQRFLDKYKTDKALKPPSNWDPSVVALLNYPDVVAMMNHDLSWTQQLGNAMIAQQADVLSAIQAFRKQAHEAGNLKSNDKQTVKVENQTIVVQSANPQTIYVPQYNPQTIVVPVAVGAPLPYYYSAPYPYYASPAATFATGAVFGAAVGFAIGWTSHSIYTGNWGWGGYYGSGNTVNVNRTNNVNINNTHLSSAQINQFNNRITQNRENVWHPSQNATARQRTSPDARGQSGQLNSANIRAELSGRQPGTGGGASPQTRQNIQQRPANRNGGTAGNRSPGGHAGDRPSYGGGRSGFQRSEGAFAGFQNGGAANRFSDRGAASLRSSDAFGGRRFQGGGGRFHDFRR